MAIRHWTIRYLVNRFSLICYQYRYPDAPWLTQQAISFLNDWLHMSDIGLEWGSGRSTVWLASRVKKLISVEHDSNWYHKVKLLLEKKGLTNVEYHLIPVNETGSMPNRHPYVHMSSALPRSSLDFVLVDGVMRDHCASASLDLLRIGGLLIIDNANWYLPHASQSPTSIGENGNPPTELWSQVTGNLRSFRCVWTSNGVTDTAFFIKL
jgi:hypothetical protein